MLALVNDMPPAAPGLFGGPSTQRFAYDALYRLTGATGTAEVAPKKRRDFTLALTYDSAGNVTRKAQTDQIFTNSPKGVVQSPTTYDLGFEYNGTTHQLARTGTRAWSHDADGNTSGWTDDATGQRRAVTWDAQGRMVAVADQGSTTTYAYDDTGRLGIERGPGGETAFVNRWYRVRNGSVAWKDVWIGDRRIATKRQFDDGAEELQGYFFHTDLQGSTNMVTDAGGLAFQHLEYFPGGEVWIHEHSDVFRTPELFTGAYYDEFRDLYSVGQRWYAPREQMFMSVDPALTQESLKTVADPGLLWAYSYAENNPGRFVDRDGRLPRSAQEAAYAAFARRPLTPEQLTGVVSATLSAADRTGPKLLRFLRAPQSSPAFTRLKAVATFEPKPLVKVDLVRTPKGLQLKKVKVGLVFGSRPVYRSPAAKAAKAAKGG
ncbi:MAG: hypothetical protein OEW29_16495 [Acidimicrobiia bacterium]|nr:hypothetical protein [Acidimicrobiia bacterium]